ncbi:hypothetical protein FQN52_001118 [Onygenales sp. PD_12]|nr:hypothetical protein FQN52_001118 [Onygenales sp. PD_12]
MFSTFSANLDPTHRPREKAAAPASTRRRNQVARACDWCRLNRVKCDDKQPCQNCQSRGGQCSNTKLVGATSLPAANREIQRLRNRVKELQEEIRRVKEDKSQTQAQTGLPTPPVSDTANSSSSPAALSNTNEGWQGISLPGTRAGGLYCGPMSSCYLVTRISRYLSQTPLEDATTLLQLSLRNTSSASGENLQGPDYVIDLTRPQEEYFLNLLWQTFHCIYPIICESDFRQYYDSLWPDGATTRQPSAFVDMLLAVCMQYGSSFLTSDEDDSRADGGSHPENTNRAGDAFYQRAQRALQGSLENPSIMTLQSHIYSVIYLYNAYLLNTAHITLGVTVRIAHALRFHLRPLDDISPNRQEIHRRLWWTLYSLDSHLSMTLGRPLLTQTSQVSCGLPEDDGKHLSLFCVKPSSYGDITWLSFHVQSTKLLFTMQSVQAAFQQTCARLLSRDNQVKDIYDDPQTTETLAEFLSREMTAVDNWVRDVPQSLRNSRKGAGEAFSACRWVALNIDLRSPLWLQRQRVLLELLYHHLQISTLRPFLRFPPVATSMTKLADSHSISCLNHAMAITSIIHQVLFETDILHGWWSIFLYQWDATICTLGFVLANPVCAPTPSARKSLQTAISTLKLIGDHFPAAADAAQRVEKVDRHAKQLIDDFRRSLGQQPIKSASTTPQNQNQNLTPLSTSNQTPPIPLPLLPEHTQPPFPTRTAATYNSHSISNLDAFLGGSLLELDGTEPMTSVDMMGISDDDTQWLRDSAMIVDEWTGFTDGDH